MSAPRTAPLKEVDPQAHWRVMTPPKYQTAKNTVTLEDRLWLFVKWLAIQGFSINKIMGDNGGSGGSGGLADYELDLLIQEYVNS